MRVAFDKHIHTRNPNSGMGVYVEKILQGFYKDKTTSLVLVDYAPLKESSLIRKVINLLGEQLAVNIKFLILALRYKTDVFYSPNPPVPLFVNTPVVLTIPDMSFCYDGTMNKVVKAYLFLVYLVSARKAKIITTFSESSKKDIVKILKIDPKKVHVTPLGVDRLSSSLKPKPVMRKFGITKKYIFSVPGTFVPRKNMADLLKAYEKLNAIIRMKYDIVLVGNIEDGYHREFEELVKESKLSNNVICTGYISKEELVTVYKGASVFVFPSLYEGFGLPPLEAMSLGVPTIVYNRSSLPEVVGDAALLVDNPVSLAKALTEVISNKNLRKNLIQKGYRQSKKFSWDRTSNRLIKIVRSAYE